jgi:UDP-N-acetylglucosamine 2-epimerase (non-hydrolysing)
MVILSVCSARPNFVKLAAVHHALRGRSGMRHVIVHTGQHYDPLFSDIFFEQLSIPLPDYNLGIRGAADREQVIADTAAAMETTLRTVRPDIILVYGDVNGALGAARAAKKLDITMGQVEAGLRSFDLSMPEELNRIDIDRIADLLFVTEDSGMKSIRKEKLPGKPILVGNTMIDTLIRMLSLIEKEPIPTGLPARFAVTTLHRPSNVDTKQALNASLDFLALVAKKIPVVFPLHRRTRDRLQEFGLSIPSGIHVTEPLGYIPFLALVKRSEFILTDSGGIQEEAVLLQKRCFTLRRNTERPSTIESGSNVLIDPAIEKDRTIVLTFASSPDVPSITVPPLWDGKAGERIAEELVGSM